VSEHELPECCLFVESDPLAKKLYAAYNAAGERKGLNYQGLPCPVWEDLTPDVRTKWGAVAYLVDSGVKAISLGYPTTLFPGPW
jgi:hypothetical protein